MFLFLLLFLFFLFLNLPRSTLNENGSFFLHLSLYKKCLNLKSRDKHIFSYRPQKNVQFLLVTGPSFPHIQNLKYLFRLCTFLHVVLLLKVQTSIRPLTVLTAAWSWGPLHYVALNVSLLHIITQGPLWLRHLGTLSRDHCCKSVRDEGGDIIWNTNYDDAKDYSLTLNQNMCFARPIFLPSLE